MIEKNIFHRIEQMYFPKTKHACQDINRYAHGSNKFYRLKFYNE